jgi:hypothetical protein
MTDVEGTQAEVPEDLAAADIDALVDQLIPPRRPRWQTALLLLLFVAALAATAGVSASGAVTPRLTVSVEQAERDGRVGAARFVVRNAGLADVRITSFSAPATGLEKEAARSLPLTIKARSKASVTVVVVGIDCDRVSPEFASKHVRIGVQTALGLTSTRWYTVAAGPFDEGWVKDFLCLK